MIMNKRILFMSFFLLTCLLSTFAQFKVVEKSAKKAPTWYRQMLEDYLIVSAHEPTLEAAQTACLQEVKKQIIQAVAQNITFAEISNLSQRLENDEITDFVDTYSSNTDVKAATVPFVQGISLSKVEEYYWEKLQDKKTKEIYYDYSIKYPFTRLELKKLVKDFEARDKKYEAQLVELENHLNEIQSLEDIQASMLKIDPLEEYFFDAMRKKRTSSLRQSYGQLYSMISIQGNTTAFGEYECHLVLKGNPIAASLMPKLKSNCASQLSARSEDGGKTIRILYDAADCLETEENFVEAIFRIGGKAVSHKFYIDVKGQMMTVMPAGKVYLTAEAETDSTLTNVNIRMTLDSRYANSFAVQNIALEVPGLVNTLIKNNINISYRGIGTYVFETVAEGDWKRTAISPYRIAFIKGSMEIRNEQNGEVSRIQINLPYVANWK